MEPAQQRSYVGSRDRDGVHVVVIDGENSGARVRTLGARASQRVLNHSPDGFEWGYGGSGPAQLALALLLDAFPDRGSEWATKLHQRIKFRLVASFPRDGWSLTHAALSEVVDEIEAATSTEPR